MADSRLPALSEVSVPELEDLVYLVEVDNTADHASGSSFKATLSRILALVGATPGGRLTLTSGTPVTTGDVTGATNVYYCPYVHDFITLYDGTRWRLYQFTELTLALGTLTSGLPYDVFVYDNAGTLTLEATAWTSDTARATALTRLNGILVKNGATTRRYLGTFRTTSTTTTEDSGGGSTTQVGGKRFLFNAYNRVRRWLRVIDTANSWGYNTDTWRVANGATAPSNCVEWLDGLGDLVIEAVLVGNVNLLGLRSRPARVGIGLDAATPSGLVGDCYTGNAGTNITNSAAARYSGTPGLGYHDARWLERGSDASCSFIGDNNADGTQSGLDVVIWN